MATEIMKPDEIKSYLSTALKLELELRSMKETRSQWEYKISGLGIPAQLEKPGRGPAPVIDRKADTAFIRAMFTWLAALIFNPFSLIVGFCLLHQEVYGVFNTAVIVIVVVSILAGVLNHIGTQDEIKRKRKQNQTAYELKVSRYEKALQEDNARLRKENLQIRGYKRDIAILDKNIARHQEMLTKLYSIPVVHPNYRDPVAMASFHDYLDTGRCDTLTGRDGAYNLYENERRLDQIVTKLDDVIYMLHDIKDSQRTLYYTIQAANMKMDKIADATNRNIQAINDQNIHLGTIAENSKLIAFNTASTARYTKLLADMDYYTKRMKGEIPANTLPSRGLSLGIE